mgnify:CR=1 FL=1
MKRVIKLVSIFLILFSLTGCVKFNANMSINKDKSMKYSVIYALDTTIFGNQSIMTDEDKNELIKKGYKIEDYSSGNMKGYTISKSFKNIDKVSSTGEVLYDISGLLDDDNNDSAIFYVKKGVFKNKYKANFKFDSSDSDLSTDENNENDVDNDDGNIEFDDSNMDFSNINANMDLKFIVNLPYSAISNNATDVSNDGKTLTWNLISNGEQSIQFEFELKNSIVKYIFIGLGILLSAFILCVIINIINNRKNKGFLFKHSKSSEADIVVPISEDSVKPHSLEATFIDPSLLADANNTENVSDTNQNTSSTTDDAIENIFGVPTDNDKNN